MQRIAPIQRVFNNTGGRIALARVRGSGQDGRRVPIADFEITEGVFYGSTTT